ncbi:MAG: twin-arginine translocase TatA/TatE family subunit [Alphaproteobacteria bacterium]
MQIIVVILLVMVLFGAGRIPTIMENLAKGVNSFKKGLKDDGTSSDASDQKKSADDKKPKDEDAS